MYTLKNNELSVFILDPIADRERLGSRYCTGGYIFQINDAKKGELLSGPEYPKPFPNVFDGQGAPDMFFTPLVPGQAPVGSEVACIGVGRVRRTSANEPFDVRYNPEVIEFVKWDVTAHDTVIEMTTQHSFADWAYQLKRRVELAGRTVHSMTSISNSGKAVLPIRWFAHPFFPLTQDNVLCRFSFPVNMPENPGYQFNQDGFICRKAEHDWPRGWYQPLSYEPTGTAMTAIQKHTKVGSVMMKTDFMPGFLPIWGNANTFSFEPYFIKELSTGESAQWNLEYRF